MFKPTEIRVDRGLLRDSSAYRISASTAPVISWTAQNDADNAIQKAYCIDVKCGDIFLWKSSWVESASQEAVYSGDALPYGERIYIYIKLRDNFNTESETGSDYFYNGLLPLWNNSDNACWITASDDEPRKAIYFKKHFTAARKIASACAYVCGLGYHKVYVNGKETDSTVMSPAHSNYAKTCYYTVTPEITAFSDGENTIEIVVGDGWRRIQSGFIRANTPNREIEFFGIPQLTAVFDIKYNDGTSEFISTGPEWTWSHGAIQMNDLYDGETYDASYIAPVEAKTVIIAPVPCVRMIPQTLEPICEKEVYPALSVFSPKPGIYVADFGQNIAGVPRIRLPKMKRGQTIKVTCHEFLDEDGTLYTATLREAKCTDTYIASGDKNDLSIWQPRFTYHGFRYAQIEGWDGIPSKENLFAVALYTDVKNDSFFTCGSALINAIHKNVVQTEKANIHSILTDCPQRDERMGWLNDATVRFEETPYNFDIGRLFPKVVRDILDIQEQDGAIHCTAPYVFGGSPADPVCSSYLVAGLQTYIHTGDTRVIRDGYDGWAAWEKLLLSKSTEYIVDYSYYGDWAGPAYACITPEHAVSACTPGILMSTGYSYFNAKTLSRFASVLGRDDESTDWENIAEKIKAAFLLKWWNSETAAVATGSQACQAFALWLGILPEESRAATAKVMRDDLVNNNYKITTGNLCTRYLFDMLAEYGYIDDAYILLTREEYPSYGFMIQNEATTVWERFEFKKDPGMNSHNHPMYGAVGYWFYAYLCGIKILSPERVIIKPYMPTQLLSAQAAVDTVRGDLSVRWVKRFGKTYLYVTIPFGVTAEVSFDGKIYETGSGSYTFEA
ncbi:MAG: family 78 glycoside hydrolase catalytic domain [Eubacteriales bacterium]